MSDETLIAFAATNPKTADEINTAKLLRPHQITILAKPLLQLLKKVENQQKKYPAVRRSIEIAGSKGVIKKWKIIAEKVAVETSIPKTVLFTNGLLESFFKYQHGLISELHKMWTPWRKKLLLEPFLSALEK